MLAARAVMDSDSTCAQGILLSLSALDAIALQEETV